MAARDEPRAAEPRRCLKRGRLGFWMMITGVFIGFFDTLLSDQDGFGRLFANGARILSRRLRAERHWGEEERLRPAALRPSPFALTLTVLAGLFFAAFAVFFVVQSLG